MRLARFSSTLTIPSGPVGGALTVTTPTLNPRKRELDVSEVGIEGVGDSVAKRQRLDEHQVENLHVHVCVVRTVTGKIISIFKKNNA